MGVQWGQSSYMRHPHCDGRYHPGCYTRLCVTGRTSAVQHVFPKQPTLHVKVAILYPKPETLSPKPWTLSPIPKPYTLNPKS